MTEKEDKTISIDDARAKIQAEREGRLTEFQESLLELQRRLGVHLEIHQIIVPVIRDEGAKK